MFNKVLVRFRTLTILQITTVLLFSVFVVYLNTFANQLFYDDEDFIYNNTYVKDLKNFPRYFSENLISGSGKISNYYRPILITTFATEYSVFQNLTFIYHFNNTLLQMANSVLVFFFIYKLFRKKTLAFMTAFLFGIHPIQTEAISYASGRGDPLSFMFMITSILFFMKSENNFKYFSKPYILSLLFFILALLSKELTIITPLLLVLVLITQKRSLNAKDVKDALKKTLPFFVILGVYLFLRLTIFNFQNTLNFYNSQNIYSANAFVRILTFLNLLPDYLALLIFPWNLFIERGAIVITSINFRIILILTSIILAFIISIKYFKTKPIFLFSLLWFFVCFIPTSGIIPINGIFYEHFLYFPSVGFFILLSQLIIYFLKTSSNVLKTFIGGLFLIYLLFLMIKTIDRNFDWHDPIKFYNQTLTHTESARVRNNLAMAYAENGDYRNSVIQYRKSIALYDYYPETHYNLGNSYLAMGKINDAILEYNKSISANELFYQPYLKLYSLYVQTNNEPGQRKIIDQMKKLSLKNQNFKYILSQIKN